LSHNNFELKSLKMVSQRERYVPLSDRDRDRVSISPAAVMAFDRVLSWIQTTRGEVYWGWDQDLANFSAAIVESTLFEVTNNSRKMSGLRISLADLKGLRLKALDSFSESDIAIAQLVGLQEAQKALIQL